MAEFHIPSSPIHLASTAFVLQLFLQDTVPGPYFPEDLPSSNLFLHLLSLNSFQQLLMSHELIRKIKNSLVSTDQRITCPKERFSIVQILPYFKNNTSNAVSNTCVCGIFWSPHNNSVKYLGVGYFPLVFHRLPSLQSLPCLLSFRQAVLPLAFQLGLQEVLGGDSGWIGRWGSDTTLWKLLSPLPTRASQASSTP